MIMRLILFICYASLLMSEGQFRLRMRADLSGSSPCFSSLFSTAQASYSCRLWEPNVLAQASFDPSRLYIFAGGAESSLNIVDYTNGHVVRRVKTDGRVVTKTLMDTTSGKLFFGTESGVLTSLDAYKFSLNFNVKVDSKINNDLMIFKNAIIFSTGFGSVYSVDINTGKINWSLLRPFKNERLHIAPNTNLLVIGEHVVVAPHPDGYLSIISLDTGVLKNTIELVSPQSKEIFPDIVAPMVHERDVLWVASYGEGLFWIDTRTWRVSRPPILKDIKEIVQLNYLDKRFFFATANKLYASSFEGNILWINEFSKYLTKAVTYSFPFQRYKPEPSRVFLGRPSNLVALDNILLMATDKGGIGFFDMNTGRLSMVLGSGLGLGPYISKVDDGIIGISLGGILYNFR